MSHTPTAKLSRAEETLNAIWRCDRKRGQTFWSNQGEQFKIMQAALEAARQEGASRAYQSLKAKLTLAEKVVAVARDKHGPGREVDNEDHTYCEICRAIKVYDEVKP